MEIRHAAPGDLARIAEIFHAAFPESVEHVYGEGRAPSRELTESLFEVCLRSEPEAFWVCIQARTPVGYIFAPVCLPGVWAKALTGGYLLRWAGGWLAGRYGLGWRPVRLALGNKFSFLRHAWQDKHKADARILSVAVHPDYRGRGIARGLGTLAVARFDRLGVPRSRLEVRPGNAAAVKIYTDLGYCRVGSMSDAQGEWWIMVRERSGS